MKTSDVVDALERIAPTTYAADWDNVGLLAGARSADVSRVLLTVDLTSDVLHEAIDISANLVVAYHPPIFHPLKSLCEGDPASDVIVSVLRAGISVYSPHTALDAAPKGVNDWLCESLGSGDVRALEVHGSIPETEENKVITYCPGKAVDAIRNGLASVGAGRIGKYEMCSFTMSGKGTFLGGEGTNPSVGRRDELNTVDEVRLEMVCATSALALAIETLRRFHPYEEPPIEIIRMERRPMRGVGQGRRIVLDQAMDVRTIADRVKSHLGLRYVQVAAANSMEEPCTHVGFCAGAGGSLLQSAISQGCAVFVTGEMRHHDVLAAKAQRCSVILAGHTATERPYLKRLAERLSEALPTIDIRISQRDVDPLILV